MLRALLCSLAASCFVMLAACGSKSEPVRFNSVDVTGAGWGSDFRLTASDGKPRSLSDFRGKAVALFFGYTHCPDVCPTTMSRLHAATTLLGKEAQRVQVVFITLDPERDTPALLAQYVPAFDPSFIGLHGSADDIAATAKEFHVFYQKQPGSTPASYTIDHTAGVFVFDPQGRLRLFVRETETPANIAADLKLLLAGK